MSETVNVAVDTATRAAEEMGERTIRIPANVMEILQQSYDTRQKVLDWLLAIMTVTTLVYVFRAQIKACLLPGTRDAPQAGQHVPMKPNQNVAGAFPQGQPAMPKVYTYNLPPSRNLRYAIGPSSTRPPDDPSEAPFFPVESC